jgi:glycosyltransferase involved in cell wall biosynthesis
MTWSVCILVNQYFGDRKIGGFGSMSRQLAEGLAGRGIKVSVVVPNLSNRKAYELINGVNIYSFDYKKPWTAASQISEIDADIYHTQNPNPLTIMARKQMPEKKHLVTCCDPRDTGEFFNEFINATFSRKIKIPVNYLLEYLLVKDSVRKADQVYVPAYFLVEKAQRMFNPPTQVKFLADITHCAEVIPEKKYPIEVLFLGRLDKRKRPEVVFDLMKDFPDIVFNIIGKAEEKKRDNALRSRYAHLPNVRWHGYINKFEEKKKFDEILAGCTAILNSSSREGLPLTFLEAAGMGCAIISTVNPDSFATRFGSLTTAENFRYAIEDLEKNPEKYVNLGKIGHAYIQELYSFSRAIDGHIEEYERIIEGKEHWKTESNFSVSEPQKAEQHGS